MAKRPTLVLFGYALYLVVCGLSPLFVLGFDTPQHFHGIRLAAILAVCGIFTSRLKRSPALAVLAIDSAGLLILGMSINYARLANNWYGLNDIAWYSPYLVGAMALGGFISFWLLMITRPKSYANCSEWWRPTPLITVPSLLILPFTRRRHGLGIPRRLGLALGALLLIVGFVFSMSHRFPQVSLAQIVKFGQFAQKNNELLRIAMDDPDLVMKFIQDPGSARELLDDPRAKEIIQELSEEGGLLHGVDTQAMFDSIASGNFDELNDVLKDSGLSGAEELLALAAEEDSPLGELLGEEGASAAKKLSAKLANGNTTLKDALSEDGGETARKLITSVAGSKSDDSEGPDMDALMQKLASSVDPKMLKHLQGAGDIDFSDSKVQDALRKMNIDPKDAAMLAELASSNEGAAAKMIGEAGSNSPGSEQTNTKVSSNIISAQVAADRLTTKVQAELDKSELTNKQPRLMRTPVAGKPKPKPLEPINVQDVVKPQQDIFTKRLNAIEQYSASEADANLVSIELANENAVELVQQLPSQELIDANSLVDANSSEPIGESSPALAARAPQQAQEPQPANTRQTVTTALGRITQQLTIPLDDHESVAGLLCMIVGLVAISASLSRR